MPRQQSIIHYNSQREVFKLHSKSSTYSFRITGAGDLEHLYYGPKINNDDDLSYLTNINTAQPFDTVAKLAEDRMISNPTAVKFAESAELAALPMMSTEDVFDAWKTYRSSLGAYSDRHDEGGAKTEFLFSMQERRLENLSWRLLHMNNFRDSSKPKKTFILPAVQPELLQASFEPTVMETSRVDSMRSNSSAISNALDLASQKMRRSPKKAHQTRTQNVTQRSDILASNEKLDQEPYISMHMNKPSIRQAVSHVNLSRMDPLSEVDLEYDDESFDKTFFTVTPAKSPRISLEELQLLDRKQVQKRLRSLAIRNQLDAENAKLGTALNPMNKPVDIEPLSGIEPKAVDEADLFLHVSSSYGEKEPRLKNGSIQSDLPYSSTTIDLVRLARAPAPNPSDRNFGKNTLCREYGDNGTGDFRVPSIRATSTKDGSSMSDLKYIRHDVYPGKYDEKLHKAMPRIRTGKDVGDKYDNGSDACESLVITMMDVQNGLQVELVYVVFRDTDVIIRRTIVTNCSRDTNFFIEKVMSCAIDFEVMEQKYYLTSLSGSWARERYPVKRELDKGVTSFYSARGTSSHQHNPFALISQGPPSEVENGRDHYGLALVYSGNFMCEVEVSDIGRVRVNMGIEDDTFRWFLPQGECFSTPECCVAYSSKGIEGISHLYHDLIRNRVMPPTFRHAFCPVLVNSWEAEYFNVNHDSVVAMARCAKNIGIELMVLDDGWFGTRNGPRSSLGDWYTNKDKFPFGLKALANAVNGEGCQFGLWIEPEMVSVDSDLYRSHPDWCLHLPGRIPSEGRNQLVLDLSRKVVLEYITEVLTKLLTSANIEYIKWDMNRHLTEVYSVGLKNEATRQGEVAFRFMMGVYQLHKTLTEQFPSIRFEGCSGGGGRFDMGVLYYVPQIWCSDNTDAFSRMKIQHGTSWLYPTITVGSHFSVCPNHITLGVYRKRTRALVSMCGTFGYELDLRRFDEEDIAAHMNNVRVHKMIRHIVYDGDLYRLWSPFETNYCAWSYVLKNKEEAVVFAFNMSSNFWSELVPRLRLRGLNSDWVYKITEPIPNNRTKPPLEMQVIKSAEPVYQLGAKYSYLSGRTLEYGGLPMRFFTQDDSFMFHLTVFKKSL